MYVGLHDESKPKLNGTQSTEMYECDVTQYVWIETIHLEGVVVGMDNVAISWSVSILPQAFRLEQLKHAI